jgi:hypothetical protein
MPEEGIPNEPTGGELGVGGEPEKFTSEEWSTKFNEGGWREGLPEEMATAASMEKFNGKGFDEVVKSYQSLEKGYHDRIPRPKEDFTPKDWSEWNKSFNQGYPDTAEDYEFGRPEGTSEDVPYNVDDEKFYKELAHESGLTESQASRVWNKMHNKQLDVYTKQMEEFSSMKKADKAALNKEWGAAAEEKMALARSVLTQYAPKELVEKMAKQYMGKDVWIMLADIGSNFQSGKIEKLDNKQTTLTPKESQSAIAKYIEKNKKAYTDKSHPMHLEVTEHVTNLYKSAFPEE